MIHVLIVKPLSKCPRGHVAAARTLRARDGVEAMCAHCGEHPDTLVARTTVLTYISPKDYSIEGRTKCPVESDFDVL